MFVSRATPTFFKWFYCCLYG